MRTDWQILICFCVASFNSDLNITTHWYSVNTYMPYTDVYWSLLIPHVFLHALFLKSFVFHIWLCECEHGSVYECMRVLEWYISMSHLFLRHCGMWEVWISSSPVELTPASLSARLLNCPVLCWIAVSCSDNPLTMSNTDSFVAFHWDIGGRHRPQRCFMLYHLLSSVLLC